MKRRDADNNDRKQMDLLAVLFTDLLSGDGDDLCL